jgi:hypothetical protein
LKILILTSLFFAFVPVHACTAFTLTDDVHALLCHNEDWVNPNTRIWFVPAVASHYGCEFVGFDDNWGQGGMNTAGLAYDWVSGYKAQWERGPNMMTVKGNPSELMLQTCATVDQAIVFFQTHWEPSFSNGNILVADRSGVSVRIGARDGVLTIKMKKTFQGFGYGGKIVSKMQSDDSQPTLSNAEKILQAARQLGKGGTKYSTVYDIKSGTVFLFPVPGSEDIVAFNLDQELKKDGHFYDMPMINEQLKHEPKLLSLMKPMPGQSRDHDTGQNRRDKGALDCGESISAIRTRLGGNLNTPASAANTSGMGLTRLSKPGPSSNPNHTFL